ncbi:hypothetical protein BC332_14711 [Capsicum chinense]|nr:hypothetical protein BC332_14711 [Capsicum chinense]
MVQTLAPKGGVLQVCSHFDLRAWCTIDQDYEEKEVLVKNFNHVTGSALKFSEDIDVADMLRRLLFGKRTELSSILKIKSKIETVGGNYLTDMPLSKLIGVQPVTPAGRVLIPCHGGGPIKPNDISISVFMRVAQVLILHCFCIRYAETRRRGGALKEVGISSFLEVPQAEEKESSPGGISIKFPILQALPGMKTSMEVQYSFGKGHLGGEAIVVQNPCKSFDLIRSVKLPDPVEQFVGSVGSLFLVGDKVIDTFAGEGAIICESPKRSVLSKISTLVKGILHTMDNLGRDFKRNDGEVPIPLLPNMID